MRLKCSEWKPRDSVLVFDEDKKRNCWCRVKSVDGDKITFTDGTYLKFYDPDYLAHVKRLELVK